MKIKRAGIKRSHQGKVKKMVRIINKATMKSTELAIVSKPNINVLKKSAKGKAITAPKGALTPKILDNNKKEAKISTRPKSNII